MFVFLARRSSSNRAFVFKITFTPITKANCFYFDDSIISQDMYDNLDL